MNNFDKQLKDLINQDKELENQIDQLPDEEDQNLVQHDLTPVVYEEKETNLSPDSINNPDLHDDYKFARSNYYGLIGRSNAALDMILKIAQMSEHPRAVEVAATLMKTSADMTKELMSLQKTINENNKGSGGGDNGGQGQPPKGSYTQNNFYYEVKDVDETLEDLPDEDTNDKKEKPRSRKR